MNKIIEDLLNQKIAVENTKDAREFLIGIGLKNVYNTDGTDSYFDHLFGSKAHHMAFQGCRPSGDTIKYKLCDFIQEYNRKTIKDFNVSYEDYDRDSKPIRFDFNDNNIADLIESPDPLYIEVGDECVSLSKEGMELLHSQLGEMIEYLNKVTEDYQKQEQLEMEIYSLEQELMKKKDELNELCKIR